MPINKCNERGIQVRNEKRRVKMNGTAQARLEGRVFDVGYALRQIKNAGCMKSDIVIGHSLNRK